MDCRSARQAIQELIDGELSTECSKELMAHVESCGKCKQHYEHLKALASGLDSLGLVHPAPEFTDSVMEKMGRRVAPRSAHAREARSLAESPAEPIPSMSFLDSILIWAKGAAVMALIVLVFGFLNLFVPIQRSTARVLSTDPQARIQVAGHDVMVPLGVAVKGNITVVDGNVTLVGRVDGDVRVVRGSVRRMPGSFVAGSVVVIDSPLAQAKDAVMGAMDWFVSAYRQMTTRVVGE